MHNEVIYNVAKKFSNVKIFDISSLFCKNGKCSVKKDGKVLFQDQDHLSIEGSLYVAPFIAEQLEKFKNQ